MTGPQETQKLLGDADRHHEAGQLAEAEAMYRQVLSRQPNHPEALRMLGLLAFGAGRQDDAVALLRRAVAVNPGAANYHGDLGAVLGTYGQLDEAIDEFRQAMSLHPDDAAACTNLANALQDKGLLDQAIEHFQRALTLRSDLPETHYNFARALLAKGRVDQAISQCQAALTLRAEFAEAHMVLGNAFVWQRRWEEAVGAYRRAAELRPDISILYYNLGNALLETDRLDDAIAAHRQVLTHQPNFVDSHTVIANALRLNGELDAAITWFRQSLALHSDPRVAGSLLYMYPFHPDYEARRICDECVAWENQFAGPLASSIVPHNNEPSPERRLRVGYVSPDFRDHCQSCFTLPLLSSHDHQRFEIFCYADVPAPDAVTQQIRQCADVWRDISGFDDAKLAQAVRADQIDILVDLTMHMHGSRLLAFARKPAPVQVSWLAYPGTTGLQTIDYRMSDPWLDPNESEEEFYCEKTVRLPNSFWCYDPLSPEPAVNELPALQNGFVTFGCLNNFSKVTSRTVDLWSKVLSAVGGSRMLVLAPRSSARQRVLDQMRGHSIDPARVQFLNREPRRQYLENYRRIDVSLDTVPCPGHTTTFDSLWTGVPVVTLPGATAISRGGSSILHNLQLGELVSRDADDYVRVAAALAADLRRLSEIRSSLRSRLQSSPLMDGPRFARDMEDAYHTMWQGWCSARR